MHRPLWEQEVPGEAAAMKHFYACISDKLITKEPDVYCDLFFHSKLVLIIVSNFVFVILGPQIV